MKSNHGKGRGSQSRRPQPQSFDASGLARPRHAESGDTPPHFGGKQASNINNPESPTTTWSTKVGGETNPHLQPADDFMRRNTPTLSYGQQRHICTLSV